MSRTPGILAVILLITLGLTSWVALRTTITSVFYATGSGLTMCTEPPRFGRRLG